MPGEAQKIIEPGVAVKAAVDYFEKVVMPLTAEPQLNLEELEMSQDKTQWLVTLSHRDPTTPSAYTLYPGATSKLYKIFTVDAHTSEVLSMKAKKT